MKKISLSFNRLWIVRGKSILYPNQFQYHIAAQRWTRFPLMATLYRSEEDAYCMIADMRSLDRPGFRERDIVEAVPLEGAIATIGQTISI